MPETRADSSPRVGDRVDRVATGLEDDGADSVQANAGSQNSTIQSRSPSRNPGPRNRPVTRQLAQRMQAHQRQHDQTVTAMDDILKWDDESQFRGLTPPPWPADLTPNKKRPRTVEEVIDDDSPREKDKMSEELERLELDVNKQQQQQKKKKIKLISRPRKPDAGPSSAQLAARQDGGQGQGVSELITTQRS